MIFNEISLLPKILYSDYYFWSPSPALRGSIMYGCSECKETKNIYFDNLIPFIEKIYCDTCDNLIVLQKKLNKH